MIDDDPQGTELRREPVDSGKHVAVIDVDGQPVISQPAEVGPVGAVIETSQERIAVDTDPAEPPIGGKAVDERRAPKGAEGEIANDGDDPLPGGDRRVTFGKIEEPLGVLDPRARLDDDRPGDAQRLHDLLPVRREHRAVEDPVFRSGPGHPLRSRRIVEVGVGIDDHRRQARQLVGCCPDRRHRSARAQHRTDYDPLSEELTSTVHHPPAPRVGDRRHGPK